MSFSRPEADDRGWEAVCVPHDWAISGAFEAQNDLQVTRIMQNGEETESRHYGRTGGLPHMGVAWYRRTFRLEESERGRRVWVEFDGVMSHSRVFVNGIEVGGRPFGYASFCVEATEAVRFGAENVLAVRVDNPPQSSRWYPGAGIYREARLVTKEREHFGYQGIWLTDESLDVRRRRATLKVQLEGGCVEGCVVKMLVESPDGGWFRMSTFEGDSHSLEVEEVALWSPETPALYRVTLELLKDGEVRDRVTLAHGFRAVSFSAETGMTLNGKPYYLKGVCLHHDLGPLGAAFSVPAMSYRLRLLKEMGCNAIRTSHNPPAPQLLDLCDTMGFAVMDEAFDCWELGKCANDYSRDFHAWHQRDLEDFIRRDRNHASVIFWSIGNEINEQSSPDGRRVAAKLAAIAHRTDPTRPVAAGLDRPDGCFKNDLPTALDLAGWNYKPHRYAELHSHYPKLPQFGSETASTVSSRGEYFFPVQEGQAWNGRPHDIIQVSSYDLEFPPWATTPDREFRGQDESPWIFGEFVWTGFDYLGEPTPFDAFWPAHASYFGIYDLVGLPKDRVWLYAARWTDRPVLHLLPHWTWPERVGQVTPVHAYINCASVELLVNGVSQGVRVRESSVWRVCWDEVSYEPGEVIAIGRDADGNEVLRTSVRTAGDPARLVLTPERAELTADGEDVVHVRVEVVDAAGTVQPHAALPVTFAVTGAGAFAAAGNGDATCTERFVSGVMSTYHGACMAIVRAAATPGELTLTATAPGVASASVTLAVVVRG